MHYVATQVAGAAARALSKLGAAALPHVHRIVTCAADSVHRTGGMRPFANALIELLPHITRAQRLQEVEAAAASPAAAAAAAAAIRPPSPPLPSPSTANNLPSELAAFLMHILMLLVAMGYVALGYGIIVRSLFLMRYCR